MTPELRRKLERRAEHLERRLGILQEENAAKTASERQASALLARYAEPQRSATPPSTARSEEREEQERERRPRTHSVTERQLIEAGLIPDPDDD